MAPRRSNKDDETLDEAGLPAANPQDPEGEAKAQASAEAVDVAKAVGENDPTVAELARRHDELHNQDIIASDRDSAKAIHSAYVLDDGTAADLHVEIVDGAPKVMPGPPARPSEDADIVEWTKWHDEMERRDRVLTNFLRMYPQPYRGDGSEVHPSSLGTRTQPGMSFDREAGASPKPAASDVKGTPGVTQTKP